MKKFLIVVDMQKDFVDGALGTQEAVGIVPAVVREIAAAKAAGATVIATLDTHTEEYLNTQEGKKLPVEHCIKGTAGWQLDEAVEKALGNAMRVEKPSFGSLALPGLIKNFAGDEEVEIELIGLCTDICVVSNALILKANFPESRVSVRKDCCAGVTKESHEAALKTLAMCQIDLI